MDIEKFRASSLMPRTARVSCRGLAPFIGENPEVEVRGLTGEEVARARGRVSQNAALSEMVEKLISAKAPEKAEAIQAALGLSGDAPGDLVYRIAVAEFGIVSFDCSQSDAVRLADAFPEDFYLLTGKILELTGLGKQVGE